MAVTQYRFLHASFCLLTLPVAAVCCCLLSSASRISKVDHAANFLSSLMERSAVGPLVQDHELVIEYLADLLREPDIWIPNRLVWTDNIRQDPNRVEYALQVMSMLLISSNTTDQQVCRWCCRLCWYVSGVVAY